MTFCVMRGPSKSLPPDVKESHDIGGKKAPYLMGLSYRLSEYSHFQTWLMHNCTVFLVFEMWTLKRQEQHQKTVPPLVSLKRGVSGLDGGEITLNEHCVSEFLFCGPSMLQFMVHISAGTIWAWISLPPTRKMKSFVEACSVSSTKLLEARCFGCFDCGSELDWVRQI